MILRPPTPIDVPSDPEVNAWIAVEHTQKAKYEHPFVIPQPVHSALAGEIAEGLRAELFARKQQDIVSAIGLHDAGWGAIDAQVIRELQGGAADRVKVQSFLEIDASDSIPAWTGSIEVCAELSPSAGYVVSGHFCRLAQAALLAGSKEKGLLQAFLNVERERSRGLQAKQSLSKAELEMLIDILQFCDLASLCLCCGSQRPLRLKFREKSYLLQSQGEDTFRFAPAIFEQPREFHIAALRYGQPREKAKPEERGRGFTVRVV